MFSSFFKLLYSGIKHIQTFHKLWVYSSVNLYKVNAACILNGEIEYCENPKSLPCDSLKLLSSKVFKVLICIIREQFAYLKCLNNIILLWLIFLYDFSLLKCIKTCFIVKHMVYPGECFIHTWKKNIFCCCWVDSLYLCVIPNWFIMLFKSSIAIFFFWPDCLTITESSVFVSNYYWTVCVCLWVCQCFLYIFWSYVG